ncbi:TPA: hypothetical protein N0F65_010744 [Lagenidium giganteum]|uniref:PH domain-containing protein n=1 Tax=Lagenidium giganteum TaxID=4803 RepID=A0AAV2YNY7_9STRA|nr:TPA: hypothetical protein N0F65_010744 [Lagenidium giganteum]
MMLKRQSSKCNLVSLNGYTAGYLRRRGDLTGTWKCRYFVFQNGRLSCRKSDKDDAKLQWEDIVLDARPSQGSSNGLVVTLASGRVLQLSARSEEHAMQWSEVFAEHLVHSKRVFKNPATGCKTTQPEQQPALTSCKMHTPLWLNSTVCLR